MTRAELRLSLDQLRAGIETELTLLRQLQVVAAQQREVSAARDFDSFKVVSEERDRLTRRLLTIEQGLSEIRDRMEAFREEAVTLPAYASIVALGQESSRLVADILACDREAMRVLADAEIARRAALISLERGETTLAAYRKVLTPPVSNAGLVDSRG